MGTCRPSRIRTAKEENKEGINVLFRVVTPKKTEEITTTKPVQVAEV